MARAAGVDLTIDDFQSVSDRVPFIADLKPSGRYVMEDVHKVWRLCGQTHPRTTVDLVLPEKHSIWLRPARQTGLPNPQPSLLLLATLRPLSL